MPMLSRLWVFPIAQDDVQSLFLDSSGRPWAWVRLRLNRIDPIAARMGGGEGRHVNNSGATS